MSLEKFNKETDPKLINKSIDIVLSETPGLSLAWRLSKALYGNAMEIRQKKALEWVTMVYENKQIFTESLFEDEQFQDGFVGALEDYLRLRTQLKRSVAQKIFLNYAQANDQSLFDLEKCNNILRLISVNAIDFMCFINLELEPKRQKRIENDFLLHDLSKSSVSADNIRGSISNQQRLSYVFDEWIMTNSAYDTVAVPSKPHSRHPTLEASSNIYIKDERVTRYYESLNELVSLGIIKRDRYVVTEPGWSQTNKMHDSWSYTEFGNVFSKFIEDIDNNISI